MNLQETALESPPRTSEKLLLNTRYIEVNKYIKTFGSFICSQLHTMFDNKMSSNIFLTDSCIQFLSSATSSNYRVSQKKCDVGHLV